MNKDQAYHQIALACLKTLRSTAATNEDTVKVLYDAIDVAFQQQFALMLAELNDTKDRLNRIQALDPQQHSLTDAQAIVANRGRAH